MAAGCDLRIPAVQEVRLCYSPRVSECHSKKEATRLRTHARPCGGGTWGYFQPTIASSVSRRQRRSSRSSRCRRPLTRSRHLKESFHFGAVPRPSSEGRRLLGFFHDRERDRYWAFVQRALSSETLTKQA